MTEERLPAWIGEHVPRELVESTLFRFKIGLQAINHYACPGCKKQYPKFGKCSDCEVKLKPKHKEVNVDMLPDLDLDYDVLEEQIQNLPAQYAFWSAVYSEARLHVQIMERKFKATKGRITEKVQITAKEKGIKFTGEQVKAVVEADAQVTKDDMLFQQAQMRCGKLWHMMEALKMKAELGRSLAGFKRQELEKS
jgi:hypothetical protein